MFDINYFKEHIHEELKGAREYIDNAIEAKIGHPAWIRIFAQMADMEIEHASHLMRMLETCIRSKSDKAATSIDPAVTAPANPETVYKDLMKAYGETMTYVTNMKRGL